MKELFISPPVPLGIGRPTGGLSFFVKGFLQGKAFNNDLPQGILERVIFMLSQILDVCLWIFLGWCYFKFYSIFIGVLL